jgi:hypothetical protein
MRLVLDVRREYRATSSATDTIPPSGVTTTKTTTINHATCYRCKCYVCVVRINASTLSCSLVSRLLRIFQKIRLTSGVIGDVSRMFSCLFVRVFCSARVSAAAATALVTVRHWPRVTVDVACDRCSLSPLIEDFAVALRDNESTMVFFAAPITAITLVTSCAAFACRSFGCGLCSTLVPVFGNRFGRWRSFNIGQSSGDDDNDSDNQPRNLGIAVSFAPPYTETL